MLYRFIASCARDRSALLTLVEQFVDLYPTVLPADIYILVELVEDSFQTVLPA